MLIDICYNVLLFFIAIAMSTKTLAMRRRFGILPARLWGSFPQIDKNEQFLIWIHAISVGETMAIIPLVRLIKDQLPEAKIMISSITETGHETAKSVLPFVDHHVFLPFDFWFVVNPIVKKVQPDLVILCETDFWYNFLRSVKMQNASVVLINGRISDISTKRFLSCKPFSRRLFQLIDYFCVQNKLYKDRFESLGVVSSKISILKNIKFDSSFEQLQQNTIRNWKKTLNLKDTDKIIVCGSTHYPEEKIVIEAFKEITKEIPQLKLVLVPRHPDRCASLAHLMTDLNIPYCLYSTIEPDCNAEVVLVDVMGKLRELYQLADAAIVGGSFVQGEGGHNILEPASYGIPFLYGPHMEAQLGFVEIVKRHQIGYQISQDDLTISLKKILLDPSEKKRAEMGSREILDELKNGDATQKTWDMIKKTLSLKYHAF